ncbi:hypothetical protein KCU73_g10160, partial [Aureobasidium melanogenum]
MNADIGGIGIRISLYVSFLVTIFSSFLGHFHQEKTVVKDIGTAQLTSMLSLAFALLRSYTTLTFWQLMVAVMSLEVTSATVQMALSQKETLASRWKKLPDQVWCEHIDLEIVEAEFLRSAALNDINGLIEFANYIPDLSTAVDDIKRTALHIALDKNKIEAIETIMQLVDREPLPEDPSTTPGIDLEKLLNTMDKTGRTPWRMIMPSESSQFEPEVLEAFLRFKHPVGPVDQCLSLLQTINMVFTLPYSLKILQAWVKAAENTQSLSRLEDGIIQAVETDNRTQTKAIELAAESVFEFCCWQYDDLGRTEFADRLFRAFVHSPSRAVVPMPAHIALRLTEFVRDRRSWAIESYTEITRIVAWKCEKSLKPIKLLLEQHSKDSQIKEQILLEVLFNHELSFEITTMLWEEWPDQVVVTSKVLEACLAE